VGKDVLEKIYKIDLVVHGGTEVENDADGSDPYEVILFPFYFISSFYFNLIFLASKKTRNFQTN